jgi:hypothetical protein
MISQRCPKHLEEYREAYEKWLEEHPDVKPSSSNRLLFSASNEGVTFDVTCPNCKLIGLNKQGYLGELDSPDDWLFSSKDIQ